MFIEQWLVCQRFVDHSRRKQHSSLLSAWPFSAFENIFDLFAIGNPLQYMKWSNSRFLTASKQHIPCENLLHTYLLLVHAQRKANYDIFGASESLSTFLDASNVQQQQEEESMWPVSDTMWMQLFLFVTSTRSLAKTLTCRLESFSPGREYCLVK